MASCEEQVEQQDVKKELEALDQYEKELQDALEMLKPEDEVRVKNKCDERKKRLEERSSLIKDLKGKIKTKEELEQMTKGKDSLIAKRIEQIQLLEDKLKEQIKDSDEKLKKELQKYNNNETRREMELPPILHNTTVLVSQKKSILPTFEETIQKASNTITGQRVENEPNQELSGNTEQMTSKTTQEMSEEEMKLAKQNDQSLRELDEQLKSLKEELQATESKVKDMKEAYEQQQQEKSVRKTVASFFSKRSGAGRPSLSTTIDQLEIKIKTMSDQLRKTENALKEEKKKREHESMMKDKQLKEQKEYYEQQLKEKRETILRLQKENKVLHEEIKKAEVSLNEEREFWKKERESWKKERESWKKEMEDMRDTQDKDRKRVEELNVLFTLVTNQQKMGQEMDKIRQEVEDKGQQLEATNENLENVKQEVANLKEKISPVPQPTIITRRAVTQDHTYSWTQSSPLSDTNVEPYLDRPVEASQKTGMTEKTMLVTNVEDDKK